MCLSICGNATGWKINTILNKLLPHRHSMAFLIYRSLYRKLEPSSQKTKLSICSTGFPTYLQYLTKRNSHMAYVELYSLSMLLHHPYCHHCPRQNLHHCQNSFQCSHCPTQNKGTWVECSIISGSYTLTALNLF